MTAGTEISNLRFQNFRLRIETMWRHSARFLVAFVSFAAFASMAEACPTCKDALAHQANYGNLPLAYMWSILFMMSMPFLILGSFGGYMYLQVKRAQRERAIQEVSAAQRIEPIVNEQREMVEV